MDKYFEKLRWHIIKKYFESDRDRILVKHQVETFDDFINKDLIHFSNYDTERSIPSMCDGLKPSQRKVLFSVIKRNLQN